jgi:hypothetical protein
MARLRALRVTAVLSAALATGCLGGQTGQPSGICGPTILAEDDAWRGDVTVGASARDYEGTYGAQLSWQEEARGSSEPTLLDLDDRLELSIAYIGENASSDCIGDLRVPVTVGLVSSSSDIDESGEGELVLPSATRGLRATLTYASQRVRLTAELAPAAEEAPPSGELDGLSRDLPGGFASF